MNTYKRGSYDGGLFRRGKIWWYAFQFQGAPIMETTRSTSKTRAREIRDQRKAELILGVNNIRKRRRSPLFSAAADSWLASKTALTKLGKAYYKQYVGKLKREFGKMLITDLGVEEIADLQKKRLAEGLSNRQTNAEIATLRAILRRHKLWAALADEIRMLKDDPKAGRAFTPDEEQRLLEAAAQSPSPSLYPFFVMTLDARLRPSETRRLQRRDLILKWEGGLIVEGEVIVPASKTDAGQRNVPLTRRACAALTLWLSRFPDAGLESFVFPSHHIGIATKKNSNNQRVPHLWGVDFTRPMSQWSYNAAFDTVRTKAKVECRLYDARHTFITRLAENPSVSIETVKQLV
jgi:integrase